MTPYADECDENELSTSEDDDDGFKEDMDALVRACRIAGTNPDDLKTAPPTVVPDNVRVDALACDVQDPLLGAGDALVPMTDSDDEQTDLQYLKRVQDLYQPLSSSKPSRTLPPPTLSDDEEDDMETLRAILKRFSAYDTGPREDNVDKMAEGVYASSQGCEEEIANSVTSKESNPGESCAVFQDSIKTTNLLTGNVERQHCNVNESCKPDGCGHSMLLDKQSKFPVSAQVFIDAIKKNRSFQRLLRSKLIQMEAKIEENERLRERVKLLKDFQASCIRRTGQALSQKKDPRVQLISTKRSHASSNLKINDKKVSPMSYGPAENAHVINYRTVLERFPVSLYRKKWSSLEKENLAKGIKQQFQEMVLHISVNQVSSEWSFGDENDFDNILASIKDLEIKAEDLRKFLPKVNWDRLASMYVVGRTGAECEARWLNCEDPLINHGPWTSEEDKFLLHSVQGMGCRNWFDIAASLNTNRTPFQCLARYQRSFNSSIINSEWSEEEDAQLCSAVEIFGVSDWQNVASVLERRTGPQCSNRWKKSLCPVRKGAFTVEEDERLVVAILLFGRKWNQIAKFVPGRTQAQCRDRYVNSLDPSLKWGGWTTEEDSRLQAAIAKHGFCWSKIAEDMHPRTDSQCRKRWRVLCPDQVTMLQAARKMKRSALISNFVDRESERPCLSLNDFLPLVMVVPPSNADADVANLPKKQKRKSSNISKKMRPRKRAKKAQNCIELQGDEVELCNGHDIPKTNITEPHLEDNSVEAVSDDVQDDDAEPCNGHSVPMPKITELRLEDNSVQAVYDHSPSCSDLRATRGQGDVGEHNKMNKLIDSKPIPNGCAKLHEENHTCISPSLNAESGTRNGGFRAEKGQRCINNRGNTCKKHCGSSDAENTISKKGRKTGKKKRMIRSAETAEDQPAELHEENHTCISPSQNAESGTRNGGFRAKKGQRYINNTGNTCKKHCGSSDAENTISKKGRKTIGKKKRMIRSAETAEDQPAELHEENHTCISPSQNAESGTRNGGFRAEKGQRCINNRGNTCKKHCDSSDAENTISKKGRKTIGKNKRMIRSAETAEDQPAERMLESQDDKVTLTRNRSKRRFKKVTNETQGSVPSSSADSRLNMHLVENQIPSVGQDGVMLADQSSPIDPAQEQEDPNRETLRRSVRMKRPTWKCKPQG